MVLRGHDAPGFLGVVFQQHAVDGLEGKHVDHGGADALLLQPARRLSPPAFRYELTKLARKTGKHVAADQGVELRKNKGMTEAVARAYLCYPTPPAPPTKRYSALPT